MSAGNVISQGSVSSIPNSEIINSANLDQTVRATVTLKSPLISLLIGQTLGYNEFKALLKEDRKGHVLNASKLAGANNEEYKYEFLDENISYTESPISKKTDVLPRPYLEVAPGAAIIGSSTVTSLQVVENGAYHGLQDMKYLHVPSGEFMQCATTNPETQDTVIQVIRGVDNTVATPTIQAGDRLLICGQDLPMFGSSMVQPGRIRKRLTTVKNGWKRIITIAMPITSLLREETLLYNGQFLDLVDQEAIRNHASNLINLLIYSNTGEYDDSRSPEGQFNGIKYFASKNQFFDQLQDIGTLTPAKFIALTTWFEAYDGVGSSDSSKMIFFCGATAWTAVQDLLQANRVLVDQGFVPDTVGSVTNKMITRTGKEIYFCLDEYLTQIGRGGDIVATAVNNITLHVGKEKFFFPPNARLPKQEDRARFMDYISEYFAEGSTMSDAIISHFSLMVAYPELVMVASGITSSGV